MHVRPRAQHAMSGKVWRSLTEVSVEILKSATCSTREAIALRAHPARHRLFDVEGQPPSASLRNRTPLTESHEPVRIAACQGQAGEVTEQIPRGQANVYNGVRTQTKGITVKCTYGDRALVSIMRDDIRQR